MLLVLIDYYNAVAHSVKTSLLVFCLVFIITYLGMRWSISLKRRLPPALWSLPYIGSTPFLPPVTDLPEYFRTTAIKLKSPVFSMFLGSEYTVVLNGRDAIEEALIKRSTDFADRRNSYSIRAYLNPEARGIIDSNYGAKFRSQHQLVLKILREFGFGQRVMEQRIVGEVEELIENIKELKGNPFNPCDHLNICTINIINSIAFGHRTSQTDVALKAVTSRFHEMINSKKRFIDFCPLLRFIPKYRVHLEEAIRHQEEQYEFIEKNIAKSLRNEDDSFVKRFIEGTGAGFEMKDLRRTLFDLLIAGSETTATSIQWAIYYMANNPDIQVRLRNEINSRIAKDRFPSLDDMSGLPYVEAAILELMRIRPVLPLSLLHYTMRDTETAGFFVPDKTRVVINLHSIHMDPVQWPDPDVYRPERFLDKHGEVTGRQRIIPFSLGKRSCLGELLARQELFLLFTTIIQRFHILPPEDQEKVVCDKEFVVSLCPTEFYVRLVPIE